MQIQLTLKESIKRKEEQTIIIETKLLIRDTKITFFSCKRFTKKKKATYLLLST